MARVIAFVSPATWKSPAMTWCSWALIRYRTQAVVECKKWNFYVSNLYSTGKPLGRGWKRC